MSARLAGYTAVGFSGVALVLVGLFVPALWNKVNSITIDLQKVRSTTAVYLVMATFYIHACLGYGRVPPAAEWRMEEYERRSSDVRHSSENQKAEL